jgi:hypothetical protein
MIIVCSMMYDIFVRQIVEWLNEGFEHILASHTIFW